MAASLRLHSFREKVRLHGKEAEHEGASAWSNRDLIPLPPSRRTWGWFHYFGYWTLSSLNISNWQTPNTYLTYGLSVGQSMLVIVVGRLLITLFSTLIAWCGLRWHVGFTVQNRFTWGLRGSYIPLLQRILLNFIWCAVQCWNAGRLTGVMLTAIWPSFSTMPNTFGSGMPTTTSQFVGFVVFWFLSLPFLWIRPEKFRLPFLVTSIYCGVGMLCMMIWSLSVAKGVGPLWNTGQSIPSTSQWNSSWLIMMGINQMMYALRQHQTTLEKTYTDCLFASSGGIAAGITNGSDFSRYAKAPKHYLIGTTISAWLVGTLVSLVGLVVTSACQKIYGEVYWNPPDLLMRMMEDGQGSSKSRAGVFFLAFGFMLTTMFENICGNAVAGGIDLAGLFPRYIDIRRGAIITFIAVWICQPWQLVNRAATFISVLSSFSVFLSPITGVMACDFYLLRKKNIKLTHLYHTKDTDYWFTHGVNWRVMPAWLAGWIPTIGGLIVTVNGSTSAPRALYQLYYMAFLIGFLVSGTIFFTLNKIFPYHGMGDIDEVDAYGTFTPAEAAKRGIVSCGSPDILVGTEQDEEGKGSASEAAVEKR